MKLSAFAGVGALAAVLLLANAAGATTTIVTGTGTSAYGVTTFTLSEDSTNPYKLVFDISNPKGGWGPNAVSLSAFAFNNIGAAGDTVTATYTGAGGGTATATGTGGINGHDIGCNASQANFDCFAFSPVLAVASDMTFNITVPTTDTPFDISGTGQNSPDLKIQFLDQQGDKLGSLFSENLEPGGGTPTPTGVPEPATWAMMIVGAGMIGAVLRKRRAMAWGTI